MHAGRRTLHKPQRKERRRFAKKKVLIFRQIAVCFLKNIVFVGRTGQRSLCHFEHCFYEFISIKKNRNKFWNPALEFCDVLKFV